MGENASKSITLQCIVDTKTDHSNTLLLIFVKELFCDCLVFYCLIRVVIEEEVISEQAHCYQETSTRYERPSVTEKEKEWIEKGESYTNHCMPLRTKLHFKSLR